MTHLHRWTPLVKNTIAYYQKGEQMANVLFEGDIEGCRCGDMRFRPIDQRLQTVGVEIDRRKS